MPLGISHSSRKGGRPAKYTSDAARKQARAARKRLARQHERAAQREHRFNQYYNKQYPQDIVNTSHQCKIEPELRSNTTSDDLEEFLPPLSPQRSPSPPILFEPDEIQVAQRAEIPLREIAPNTIDAEGEMNDNSIIASISVDSATEEVGKLGIRLFEQLLQHQGCCTDCHAKSLDKHAHKHAYHLGLQAYLNRIKQTVDCPDVLGLETLASRETNLAEQVNVEARRRIYCGPVEQTPDSVPPYICLNSEDRPIAAIEASFDIDSILGFSSSLAAAKQGIRWNPTQMPVSDLQSDMHLNFRKVHFLDRHGHAHTVRKPIHQLPHYTFGRLVGFEDISLYFFFPHLYREEQQSSRLLDNDFRIWMDRVLLPAIYRHYGSSLVQHYPSSYDHSRFNSTARGVEKRSQRTDPTAREQRLFYFLPPDALHKIWGDILEAVQRPGLQQFRDVFILLHAKNLKTLTKDSTWEGMTTRFQKYWLSAVADAYVGELYFDIGKEVCSATKSSVVGTSSANSESFDAESEGYIAAETLLWKRCCLETFADRIQSGHGEALDGHKRIFYPFSMLQDSGSLTVEPNRSSKWRGAGLLYSQFYSSIKEIFAAGNVYPFIDTAIEGLALDPKLRKTWEHVSGALSHNPVALMRAYLYTKLRCHHAIRGSTQKHFGTREEHRISRQLFAQIDTQFRKRGLNTKKFQILEQGRPFYTYSTATILEWLRWNINKFCVGFETVFSLSDHRMVTWEHTRVMLMFLRCLQFSYTGGLIQKVSGCWQDVRCQPDVSQPGGIRRFEGLGFRDTMSRYGYAWFMDKVDWNTMTFHLKHRPYMQFNSPSMLAHCKVRYRNLRDVQADFILIEDYFSLMKKHSVDKARSYALLSLLVDICLRAFRKDVFQHIRQLIRSKYLAPALSGSIALCGPTVEKIIKPAYLPLHFVSGNRMAVKTADILFDWLWDWRNEEVSRQHWSDKPYRMLYQQCDEVIGIVYGPAQAQSWRFNLKERFIQTHWILPYPDKTCLFSRTKKQQYCWWSSYHSRAVELSTISLDDCCSTADVVDLPIDEWRCSLKTIRLEIKLPWIPQRVDRLLQQLPAVVLEDAIAFPALRMQAHGYQLRCHTRRQDKEQADKNRQWLDDFLPVLAQAQKCVEKENPAAVNPLYFQISQAAAMEQVGNAERLSPAEGFTIGSINERPARLIVENPLLTKEASQGQDLDRCQHMLSLEIIVSGSGQSLQVREASTLISGAHFSRTLPLYNRTIHPRSRYVATASTERKVGRPKLQLTQEERILRKKAQNRSCYQRRKALKRQGVSGSHPLSILTWQHRETSNVTA